MKIRTQLMLSLSLVIALTTVSMMLIALTMLDRLTEESLRGLKGAVGKVTKDNYEMSEEILSSYGQRIVILQARCIANELSEMLKGRDVSDYHELRQNMVLRRMATQNIHSWDRSSVGYVDLIDRKGISVLHPNPAVEGKNFGDWKNDYPDMWGMVQRSFTEDEVSGNYFFLDRDNHSRHKFMVIKHIKHTPFNLCAVVNIDDFYLPVHQKIGETDKQINSEVTKYISAKSSKMREKVIFWILLSGIVVMLFGLVYALWLANFISQPILKLHQALTDLDSDASEYLKEDQGTSETILLTSTFNKMKARIDARRKAAKSGKHAD